MKSGNNLKGLKRWNVTEIQSRETNDIQNKKDSLQHSHHRSVGLTVIDGRANDKGIGLSFPLILVFLSAHLAFSLFFLSNRSGRVPVRESEIILMSVSLT